LTDAIVGGDAADQDGGNNSGCDDIRALPIARCALSIDWKKEDGNSAPER